MGQGGGFPGGDERDAQQVGARQLGGAEWREEKEQPRAVHVLSLPAHHVVVVANDLWYTRAAHGLTAAAPERAPLKGNWVDIHEEASRRLLGVGRARPTGFWANWPVFGQSATSILPTDRPAFEQPTARPTHNRTSRGLAPPAFGFRLGWAHDTFPHSALACILYHISSPAVFN